jgi:hypothetical protein
VGKPAISSTDEGGHRDESCNCFHNVMYNFHGMTARIELTAEIQNIFALKIQDDLMKWHPMLSLRDTTNRAALVMTDHLFVPSNASNARISEIPAQTTVPSKIYYSHSLSHCQRSTQYHYPHSSPIPIPNREAPFSISTSRSSRKAYSL